MAIKETISLEGVEQVKSAIAEVVRSGEQGAKAISATGKELGGAAAPIQNFFVQVKKGQDSIKGFNTGLIGIKDSLRVLKPVVSEFGGALGGLGAFAAASRVGLVGLGAAISGAFIVKLTNMADETEKTKKQLADLLGSRPQADNAFKLLDQDAQKLGTTVEAMRPAISSLFTAIKEQSGAARFFAAPGQDLPAILNPINKAKDAFDALFTVMRKGGASFTEATKGTTDFAAALQAEGALTGQVMQTLRQFPGTYRDIQTALGGAGKTQKEFEAALTQSPVTINRLLSALAQAKAQIPTSFDPKAPQSLADAISLIGDALKRGFQIEQPKELEKAVANIVPVVKALAEALKTIAPPLIGAFTNFFKELVQNFEITKTQIANLSVIWTEFRKLISVGFTSPTFAPIAAQFEKLKSVFAEIERTGVAPGVAIDKLKQAFTGAAQEGQQAGDKTEQAFGKVAPQVNTVAQAFVALGQSEKQAGDQAVRTAQQVSAVKFVSAGALPPGSVQPGGLGTAQQAAAAAPQQPADKIVAPFEQAKQQIVKIMQDIVAIVSDTSGITTAFESITEALVQPFLLAENSISDAFESIAQAAEQMATRIEQAAQKAAQALQGIGGGLSPSFGLQFASGGPVFGPGTSTSDSILARLSSGEFVHPTRRVQQYGMDFMESLRRGLIPVASVRALMGDFAGAMPRLPTRGFASGGQVTTQPTSTLVLNIGGRSFEASADQATITSLRRFAVNSQLASIGRKPGFVR